MEHLEHCDLLEQELARLVAVVAATDPTAEVPSCPEWTAADLALHLGKIHRWADGLVKTLSTSAKVEHREPRDLNDVRPEQDGTAEQFAEWLRYGGARLLDTLRAADPDTPMWAWGVDQHVRFWSRRQLHETVVHRVDFELAGQPAITRDGWEVAPAIAVDGIDEFFDNLAASASFNPSVAALKGEGMLHFHATDAEGEWLFELTPDGFAVTRGHAKGDVAARGPAASLLGLLYRRAPISTVEIFGDRQLLAFWDATGELTQS